MELGGIIRCKNLQEPPLRPCTGFWCTYCGLRQVGCKGTWNIFIPWMCTPGVITLRKAELHDQVSRRVLILYKASLLGFFLSFALMNLNGFDLQIWLYTHCF